MKRRSVLWIFVTTLIVVTVAYLAYQITSAFKNPVVTKILASSVVTESISARGYVVTDGITLDEGQGRDMMPVISAGEKVAREQNVCILAEGESVVSMTQLELAKELAVYDSMLYQKETPVLMPVINREVLTTLAQLDEVAAGGMYSGYDSEKGALIRLLSKKQRAILGRDWLKTLRERREEGLFDISTAHTGYIKAPQAGYYLPFVNSWDSELNLDTITTVSIERFKENVNKAPLSGDTAGRIMTGLKFDVAFLLENELAKRLKVGRVYNISDMSPDGFKFNAELIRLEQGEKETLCIFSSDNNVGKGSCIRSSMFEIPLESYEGFKIPKEAIRKNEAGEDGVYIISGVKARFRTVKILSEREGYFIVAPEGETGIRQYDELIINGARGLSDGKIVR